MRNLKYSILAICMCVNRMIVHLCMYIILTELIEDNNFLDNTISKSYFEIQNEKEGVDNVLKNFFLL